MAAAAGGFALVTGTSAGIGAEVATQLVRAGWTVVGVSRRSARLTDEHYQHLSVDLSDVNTLATIEQYVAPMLRDTAWTRVGLVNNAADVGQLGRAQDIDAAELMKVYATNVAAPVWCMGLVSRLCPATVPLRIVNVSTGAATQGVPGLADYGSSKAALRLAGMVFAAEWQSTAEYAPRRSDAAILSYEPGTVDTAMQATARAMPSSDFPWVDSFQNFRNRGQLVPPAEPAAEIVAFLEARAQPAFGERRLASSKN